MATIDADTHVIESERTWDYIDDSELRPQAITIRGPDGQDQEYWRIDGRFRRRGEGDTSISREIREMADLPGRMKKMDELQIDVQVLYPTLMLIPVTTRPDVEVALCKSYNRWLADVWRDGGGRFRWILVPPLSDLPTALAEIEFGKHNGACGISMRGIEDERQLSDPQFYGLYEKASELDLPICIHTGSGNMLIHELLASRRLNNYFRSNTPVLGAFNEILTSALPDRFPKLRFGFIEAGSDWLPYMMREVNRRNRRIPVDQRAAAPMATLQGRNLWVSCRTDDDLPYVIQSAGEDCLITGTDFGHIDPAAEMDAFSTMRVLDGLEPRVIKKITDDNPRAFYGI